MIPKLGFVNLKKYWPFFQECAGSAAALVLICDESGLELLAQEGDADQFEALIKQLESPYFSKDAGTLSSQDVGTDGILLTVAVWLPHQEQAFYLAGLLKSAGYPIDSAQRTKASHTLEHIAACIVDDYTLQLTLSGMADELTVRYEELNLIYGLDDAESHRNPLDEQQALSHLINNCTDYMNVDLAVLYAPGLDILLQNSNPMQQDIDLVSTLEVIQQPLYQYLLTTRKTLVINQNRDIDWTDANLTTTNKILAAPILMNKHYVVGILVLVNAPDKPDFSNSDRKLGDVLASEVIKIIQSRRDTVTGLFNRRGFTEKLQQALTLIKTSPIKSSLLFVDIDQFKIINDSAGQKAGDQLLNQVGGLIHNVVGQSHVVGRVGADEFGVILASYELAKAEQFAASLGQSISQFRFSYQNKLFDISVCIGVVELLPEMADFSVPFAAADLACSVAKEQGRSRVHGYHSSDESMIRHENEIQWMSRLTLALEQQRFLLYRQKIQLVDTTKEAEEHYEVLLRLKDENGKLVPPDNFIPAAERYNLMSTIDRWVVTTALAKMAGVLKRDAASKLSCSINLSGQSFCEPGFVEFVMEQVMHSGVPSERICFEITETAAVSNLAQTIRFMEKLKSIGCSFSLDDFGSGMSSFTYLKNLPVDYLKIDGYFVKTMLTNAIDYAMVKSINEIGQVMGLKTIAEFVENEDIFQELKVLGIDYGQGYGLGKPEPFE